MKDIPITTLGLSQITLGDRYRQDLGDIDALASSIDELGLLQPIGVTPDFQLIWGHRRLQAVRQLGWYTIAARVVPMDDIVLGEYAENEVRKDFTTSEKVAIGEEVERILGNRQGQRTDLTDSELQENFPEVKKGQQTRDVAAQKAGFGNGKTYQQARTVVEKGVPELVQVMDDGKVSISVAADVATLSKDKQRVLVELNRKDILNATKAIRTGNARRRQADNERIRKKALSVPPPEGQYRCIVVDPPWPMKKMQRDLFPSQTPDLDYPTLHLEDIRRLSMPSADRCHLYLWTTQKFLHYALLLMSHWGFDYLCTLVWHKAGGFQVPGLPQFNCEFALLGRKGGLEFNDTKAFPTCFQAPRREHSRKPEYFYELVRRVSPGPRLDMFSREPRSGYHQYGVEPDVFVQ